MAFRPTISAQPAHELIQRNSSLATRPSSLLLWLDADCQLRAPLDDLKTSLKKNGIYSPCIPGTIETRLHPTARAPLKITDDLLPKPLRDAGICAFDLTNPQALGIPRPLGRRRPR